MNQEEDLDHGVEGAVVGVRATLEQRSETDRCICSLLYLRAVLGRSGEICRWTLRSRCE
jgi:hypothetical protein